MNTFLKKDSTDNWNTLPPVPSDEIKNVNCHKFILYVMGDLSWEEMVLDPNIHEEQGVDFTFAEKAQKISDIPFNFISDLPSLFSFAEQICVSEKAYVGQILDTETQTLAHSFILKKVGTTYECFDKPGFKYPFGVHTLETIFNFINKDGEKPYPNQKWRFVPV
jgi:hypothetical protein